MVTRIKPTSCVKQLTIMGWVAHVAGVLCMGTALATEHWLRRLSTGHHVGIFPCCPTFKCDKKVVFHYENNFDTFTNIIIMGLLLVGLGLTLSLTQACVSWRTDKRTLFGLSYLASGIVTTGGITLAAGAIEFVTTIPSHMQDALREECHQPDDIVETGFSYSLFATGAAAFILAGILLFLSSWRQRNPLMLTGRRMRPSIAVSESCVPLGTVSAHLESQERMSPVLFNFTESFNNPVYNTDAEVQQICAVMDRLSPRASPCQCDRLSPHATRHQSGRLSLHYHRDRLSPHADSRHQHDRSCTHHQRDRLSPRLSPHQRDRLSPYQHDRLSPHQRDRLSPHHRERLSPHHQHDRSSPHHDDHCGFRPLSCPPSYESLRELFLLNISDDSEFHESRATTELHDQQDNSQESAAQPPPYEDVLKTYPPPYKQ